MNKKYTYLIVIFLIAASCASFGRIAGNDFINFDDLAYITDNHNIQSGFNLQNIKWAFTAVVVANWHPLTLLSLMLDWNLFGANASGYHLVNVLLHIGAVIFLFLSLNKTTKNLWPSAFVAALFALHPLRVESVAWASERKDVLSMLFGMSSIYAYAFYAESAKLSRYILCLILFALALMAKPMMVTLPFLLMLLDYWPLGRWQKVISPAEEPKADAKTEKKKTQKRKADSIKEEKISSLAISPSRGIRSLIWEKIPFFFLIIATILLTFWAQKKGDSFIPADILPFLIRSINAILSYAAYLGKIFWPINLAVFYPFPDTIPVGQVIGAALLIVVITMFVIVMIKRLPFLFVGWFWYLGTLIPVIGLVQVGKQAMADRYTYLPSVGIAIMLAWGIRFLFPHESMRKKILFPAAASILVILAILTWQQCGYWRNSIEIWNHASVAVKDNYLAYNRLGDAYYKLGQYQRAIEEYNEAIRLEPDSANDYSGRGEVYVALRQYQQALDDFNKTIQLKPDHAKAYLYRGNIYNILSQYQLAREDYNKAIILRPDYAEAYFNRAIIYLMQGNKEMGCLDAQKACGLGDCKILEAAKGKGDCR